MSYNSGKTFLRDNFFKIIAHLPLNGNKPPLEGVYRLPCIGLRTWDGVIDKEDIENVHVSGNVPKWYGKSSLKSLIEGYKRAGSYTEEDIKRAWNEGMKSVRFNAHRDGTEFSSVEEFIKSLKRNHCEQPKATKSS